MKKLAITLLIGACPLMFNAKALADKEKENFQSIAESIKNYSNNAFAEKEIENDFCVKKFESKEVFNKWDKLLNEVYQYLKKTKSSDEFNSIKQQQRNWIKEKETASKEAINKNENGKGELNKINSEISFTKTRVEILIDLIEEQ